MTTPEAFRRYNFHFFNEIMDKNPGVIETNFSVDPRKKRFDKPIVKVKKNKVLA